MPKPKRIDVSLLERDRHVAREELRDRFYKLRDLEIQNLWQRASIFAGLIGLFFAGYGYIILELIKTGPTLQEPFAHLICCGIAILAIIFSVIWIKMTKGAKAWFEVQERNISEIEAEVELKIPLRYQMGKLSYPGIDNEPNNSIFSTSCGAYSVSKLNIFFGQVLLYIWIILLSLHAFGFLGSIIALFIPISECVDKWRIIIVSVLIIAYPIVALLITHFCKERIHKIYTWIRHKIYTWIRIDINSGAILDRSSYLKKRQEILFQEFKSLEGKIKDIDAGTEITQVLREIKELLRIPDEAGNASQSSQEVLPNEDTIKKDEKALDLLHFLIDRVRDENGFYSVDRGIIVEKLKEIIQKHNQN